MSERERLKKLSIPSHLEGRRIVMSTEMFVAEMQTFLGAFAERLIEDTLISTLPTEDRSLIYKQYVLGYLDDICKLNINSKPDDPEEFS